MDLGSAQHDLVEVLGRGDRRAALRHAMRLLDGGCTVADLVLGLLAPAQAALDERTDGAGEHTGLAAEVADTVLTVAASHRTEAPDRGRLVLCVADREHHNLPPRMVAELLRVMGFQVMFLGTPRDPVGIVPLLQRYGADALFVSCSLTMNLPAILPLTAAAHGAGLPVLVGGNAFGDSPARAGRLGADAWVASLEDTGDALARVAGQPPALPDADAVLAHGELVAMRDLLVRELSERVAGELSHLLPRALREPRALRRYLQDLLLFVEAAVLCDPRILVDYVHWLVGRNAAEGGHPQGVRAVVSLLEQRMTIDVPPCAEALAAARDAARVG